MRPNGGSDLRLRVSCQKTTDVERHVEWLARRLKSHDVQHLPQEQWADKGSQCLRRRLVNQHSGGLITRQDRHSAAEQGGRAA